MGDVLTSVCTVYTKEHHTLNMFSSLYWHLNEADKNKHWQINESSSVELNQTSGGQVVLKWPSAGRRDTLMAGNDGSPEYSAGCPGVYLNSRLPTEILHERPSGCFFLGRRDKRLEPGWISNMNELLSLSGPNDDLDPRRCPCSPLCQHAQLFSRTTGRTPAESVLLSAVMHILTWESLKSWAQLRRNVQRNLISSQRANTEGEFEA